MIAANTRASDIADQIWNKAMDMETVDRRALNAMLANLATQSARLDEQPVDALPSKLFDDIADRPGKFDTRLAILNAKAQNMPKDNIETAIKRAAGKDMADISEVNYEAKGPHGVMLFIETATDKLLAASIELTISARSRWPKARVIPITVPKKPSIGVAQMMIRGNA